jgi:tRNA pseudouridine38-40 synthase
LARYAFILAYDGTHYHGWQKQPNTKTVQEVIEEKISLILNSPSEILGCGRTDTGVHAAFYVAHADLVLSDSTHQLKYKLNKVLPADISISDIKEVHPGFHARFDAEWREYKYYVSLQKNIWLRDFSYLQKCDLNLAAMQLACQYLLGSHDFSSFCKIGSDNGHNLCHVTMVTWEKINDQLVFTIRANRFLRNMVRAIVGTMLEIGEGKLQSEDIQKILKEQKRTAAKKSARAAGLFLNYVKYP